MSTFIKPTLGRIVYFHPAFDAEVQSDEITYPAMIVHVQPRPGDVEYTVNLIVFRKDGTTEPWMDVPLIQDGQVRPAQAYCDWMPYQIGQARSVQSPVDLLNLKA